jgi:hypothetical protein
VTPTQNSSKMVTWSQVFGHPLQKGSGISLDKRKPDSTEASLVGDVDALAKTLGKDFMPNSGSVATPNGLSIGIII